MAEQDSLYRRPCHIPDTIQLCGSVQTVRVTPTAPIHCYYCTLSWQFFAKSGKQLGVKPSTMALMSS